MELYAARAIAAPSESVFDYLQSFERVLELIDGRVESLGVSDGGSRVRLRGPSGVRRTVRTGLTYARSPESIVGQVEAGRLTRGTVRCSIQRSDTGSWVEVVGRAEALGLLDRVLLGLGGRRWLARSIELALEEIDRRLGAEADETR